MAWFPCNIGGSIEPEEEKTLLFTHNNLASWTTYEVSNDVDDILIESTYTLHEKEVTERTFLKLSGVGVWPYYDHIAISSTQVLDIGFKDNTIHFRSQNNIAASYNAVTNIYSYKKGSKSKYIKATGSFTSGTESWQKVEVNCGFKPDLVMVDMAFGNGFTRATYLSTAWYEETDHPTSVWDLRPMENVIYAITPGSEQGETGISDLTDTGFKYRVNGGNTQGKACTYTAIKFDAESAGGGSVIEDYTTNYFSCLLNDDYYTVFSKVANDEIYNGGRGGTRTSSDPVFYFCCKTTSFWGYGLIGLTSASVQVTATTTYGSAVYYTQTTTNGNMVYLARLASMNGGQSSTVFKNG